MVFDFDVLGGELPTNTLKDINALLLAAFKQRVEEITPTSKKAAA